MDQIILGTNAVEGECASVEALQNLSDLELALVGGGIGDTILK